MRMIVPSWHPMPTALLGVAREDQQLDSAIFCGFPVFGISFLASRNLNCAEVRRTSDVGPRRLVSLVPVDHKAFMTRLS